MDKLIHPNTNQVKLLSSAVVPSEESCLRHSIGTNVVAGVGTSNVHLKREENAVQIFQDLSGCGDHRIAHIHIGDNIHYHYGVEIDRSTTDEFKKTFPQVVNSHQRQNNSDRPLINDHVSDDTVHSPTIGKFPSAVAVADPTRGLKKKLQSFYKKATLPRVAWLNHGRDLLMKNFYVDLQLNEEEEEEGGGGTVIKLENVFDKVDDEIPTRVLLEGQPGFGKTTSCIKLAYDWALEKAHLRRFQLVLSLPLRQLQGHSLDEGIAALVRRSGFEEPWEEILSENKAETLFILDGFDELSKGSHAEVLQILYELKYDTTTVLVTCRSGLFDMEDDDFNKLFGVFPVRTEFYQKKVTVLGIGLQDRPSFLAKFCSAKNAEKLSHQFEKIPNPTSGIFQCPLLLLMMAYFSSMKQKVETDSNLTNLYKSLVSSVIKCSVTRVGKSVDKRFDIFDVTEPSSRTYQECLEEFGDLCLTQLAKKEYGFDCDQLTDRVYDIGLLTKHKVIDIFESELHYEPFHLSFIEFVAAYSLWRKFIVGSSFGNGSTILHNLDKQQIENLNSTFETTKGTTLVPAFLLGLMNDFGYHLLRQLKSHTSTYFRRQIGLWRMFAECRESEKLLDSATVFIPSDVHKFTDPSLRQFYTTKLHANLIRQGIENEKLCRVDFHVDFPLRLPLDVTIPKLNVTLSVLNDKLSDCRHFEGLKDVQCNKLGFFFPLKFANPASHALLEKCFSQFLSISARKKTLCLKSDFQYSSLMQSVTNGVFANGSLSFDCVFYNMNPWKRPQLDCLYAMLEMQRIQKLHFMVPKGSAITEVGKLIDSISQSSALTNLTVENYNEDLMIDFHQLTEGGKRQWKRLEFWNVGLECCVIGGGGGGGGQCDNCSKAVSSSTSTSATEQESYFELSVDPTAQWSISGNVELIFGF